MAAFEHVSKMVITPEATEEGEAPTIDIRKTVLPKDDPPIDDYDPREHRTPETPINISMAYFNLLRTIVGTGLLGYPLAMSQAGLLFGPFIAIFTGMLVTYSHHLLLKSLNEVARRLKVPHISYRYGFRLALLNGPFTCRFIGFHGPTLIATCMIISQLGTCTVIVIFTSDCLKDILDWTSIRPVLWLLIIPFIILEHLMKNLKIVTHISNAGNFVNFIALIIVIYLSMKDIHGYLHLVKIEPLPIMFTFGTCLFNSSAVGVILSLDRSIVDPKELVKPYGVISFGIMVPCIFGTLFGIFGYISFGAMEENVLRYLPFDDNVALIAIGFYMFSMFFVYPIQCYPGVLIICEVIKNRNPRKILPAKTMEIIEMFIRPIFVIITFLIAYAIPFQGPFVAFVGNLCTTLLVLIFPALMDFSLHYPHVLGKHKWILIRNLAVIIVGLVSLTIGVYLCSKLIYVRILALTDDDEEYF